MAHTSCPNGHRMWNGDGTPVVWAFRVRYIYDYMKDNPDCVFGFGDRLWQIYDCVDDVPGEALDCWYCDECQGLVVFVDTFRYDFNRMKKTPEISLSDVDTWEEYIAFRDDEFDQFTEFYEGKSPVWAIEHYPFQYKYRLSPDKKTIYAFDATGHIQFGYEQVHFTDFGQGERTLEPRDARYPYSSSDQSQEAKRTEKPKPLFEGKLKKLQLTSNIISYGLCPEPDEEIEQRLTIKENGRVWVTHYCYGENRKHSLLRKDTFGISLEAARKILGSCAYCFSELKRTGFFTDVGYWNIKLTNTDGKEFKINGSIGFDLKCGIDYLSNIIRKNLGKDDLFVFDGNPDSIGRLELLYHRITKNKSNIYLDGSLFDQMTIDNSERLVIDGKTDTIKYSRKIGSGCMVTSTYHIEGVVSDLLDKIKESAFSNTLGNPPDAIDDSLDSKEYKITVFTKHGKKHTITGSYDKHGLPICWPDIIAEIVDFLSCYGIGEIFDKHIFGKAKRRESDLIFCNVEFEDGGRTYCYLADNDDYVEGDLVVVPTGSENREAIVRIESIEYHPPEEAPFPLKKIKHILRRCDRTGN